MALMDQPAYSKPVQGLLDRDSPPMGLVCTRKPLAWATAELASARVEEWFPGSRHPEAAMAGLWLRFAEWDRAHAIVQDLRSAESSYWHAIIHRQEPDGWNAGYWFRRVRHHPVFKLLAEEARRLAAVHSEAGLNVTDEWDPFAFVEYCESQAGRSGESGEILARQIQDAEWRLLFAWCVRG